MPESVRIVWQMQLTTGILIPNLIYSTKLPVMSETLVR